MSYPATVPPVRRPLYTEPFLVVSHGGLFAAPWLGRPTPDQLAAVEEQSRTLAQADVSPVELTAALSYLLAIRAHCMRAAMAGTPAEARTHYTEALRACQTAMNLLHHAHEGTPGALAAWAQGVHTLIRAQLAMPDLAAAETLAREAIVTLSLVEDPLCEGCEADAHAATLLAREPAELAADLDDLPNRILDKVDYVKYRIDYYEGLLNQRLTAVTDAHTRSLVESVGWGVLNLLLMASLPLNGWLRPDIPWSIPFVLGVPTLWWWTWDRPYKEGTRFFDYLRLIRQRALDDFHKAAAEFPHPAAHFRALVADVLRQARAKRDRLTEFCLGVVPDTFNSMDEAALIADEGRAILHGEWKIELKDRDPWPLDEALAVEPSMVPWSTRIFYDTKEQH